MRNAIEIISQSLEEVKREFSHLNRQKIKPEVRAHLVALWEQFRAIHKEVESIQHALENPFLYPEESGQDHALHGQEEVSLNIDTASFGSAAKNGPREVKIQETAASPVRMLQPVAQATSSSPAKPKVLIIDDCENTQNILSYTLQKKGYTIKGLTDPTKSIATVTDWQPELILLDLMMPEMDGFEVLKQLRANTAFDKVQIIVGSSRSYDKDRLTVLGLGANDFIAKPYNVKELGLRIRNFLAAKPAAVQLNQASQAQGQAQGQAQAQAQAQAQDEGQSSQAQQPAAKGRQRSQRSKRSRKKSA